ncbi:MAG: M16 family metallopeptidase [Myxococcaceae bacterium]
MFALPLSLLLTAVPALDVAVTRAELPNGLKVLIAPDRTVPGVTINLLYHVGSKDEQPGRTGFAHLFEHLMFMGARYVPYPQFDTLMEAAGGVNNASTGNDVTDYYSVGPSNLLETFLWMESDRLLTLGQEMTQQKLETQLKVVLNERRQSYENVPYGKVNDVLPPALFPKTNPYSWPVIGSAADLRAATLNDVKEFFATWYVPSNASLVIAGDVDPAQAMALVNRYFAFLPKRAAPRQVTAPLASLSSEVRLQLSDKVELEKVVIAYLSPRDGTAGDAACDVLATVLGRGKASRLYARLVYRDQLATEVEAEQDGRELQGVFTLSALARPKVDAQALVKAIDEELQRLRSEGPTSAELEAARTLEYTDAARRLESLVSRAEFLNRLELTYGVGATVQRDLDRYQALTPASVRETAQQVFGPGRVVVEVRPEPKVANAQEPK